MISVLLLARCLLVCFYYIGFCFFHGSPSTEIYTLSLHDALPILSLSVSAWLVVVTALPAASNAEAEGHQTMLRSEEHTSELQSHSDLVCRLLLEKKNRQLQRECLSSLEPLDRPHARLSL